jgi:hypothetical protein
MIFLDVDTALSEVPVNSVPLTDDTDFKTIETAVAYNAAGMALNWHFLTTTGIYTVTAVTPTSGGSYDWLHQAQGMYTIEIPASAGASINNDTEGFGWFTGFATGILPWRGPTICFRAAGINDKLIDSPYDTPRGLAGTALPNAAAEAAGGLYTRGTGAGQINQTSNGTVSTLLANGAHGGVAAVLTLERAVIASTTAGEPAFKLTGNTTGAGLVVEGGTNATGAVIRSGASAGHGLYIESQPAGTTYSGIYSTGGKSGLNLAGDVGLNVGGFMDVENGIRANITVDITGKLTGAVGSVTGNVGGNVVGTVASVVGNVGGSVASVVGNVGGSVGSIAGVTFPANFGALAITGGGATTVGTNTDKSGYTISGTLTTLDAFNTSLNSAHGPGSWATATGFSTLTQADVRAAVGLTSANLDTQLGAIGTLCTFAVNVLEGDREIVTGTTPWTETVKIKGTGTVLMTKILRDVNGNGITSTSVVIGSAKDS